ncbi:MAG: hypothetical protein U0270_39550 [Labilithrix sp.]
MSHESVDAHYDKALRDADVGGLIAAARKFMDVERLDDAQSALLAAGRLQPREGEIYRWLGEVLLRRGDAERAEKVLEKAVQFGSKTNAIPVLEHARGLIPTQHAAGEGAVAELVAQERAGRGIGRKDITGPFAGSRRFMPPESDGEIETAIRSADALQAQIEAVLNPLSEPGDYPDRGSDPRVPAPRSSRGKQMGTGAVNRVPSMPDHPPHDEIQLKAPTRALEFDIPGETGPLPQIEPAPLSSRPGMPARTQNQGFQAQDHAPESSRRGLEGPPSFRVYEPPAPISSSPILLEKLAHGDIKLGGAAMPEARDVLDALESAGVYEPDNVSVPQVFPWTRPEKKVSKRSMGVLIGFAVALVIGGVTTFVMVTNARARDHVIAEQTLAQVDKDLDQGDAKLLDAAEKSISKTFELESRSPHAAMTWLHERVVLGLLKGGQDIAFEDANTRAKEVGIEEKKLAFSYVASFLFQGDTAGAAAVVAKWDQPCAEDPWFQLLAGATFERAGDPRALERYSTAVRLAPEMVLAQILLNRAMAVDGDPKRAGELAKEIRIRQPNRIESAALVLLAWARDPNRGEPPPEAKDVMEKADTLPLALRSVPYAARAILAIPKGMADEARSSLQKGLNLADTPGMATWLGSIALVTGDEELARKAALAALSFSAAYPPARVLAARVALFAARLDEALKATEDLPTTGPDVAIVTAAASYEKLDSERMSRALEGISEDARKSVYVQPLVRGQALMAGKLDTLSEAKALESSDDEAPWADLVSIDWALDSGDIDVAKKIAATWRGEPRAMRAVRLARLARYDGRLEDAEKFSKMGLESGTPTMRALSERVFTLIAAKKDNEALALFKTYPNVGGPMTKWLRAYATASHGKIEEAKGMVSQEDPPPATTPLAFRVIAAMAYAAMKDVKHGGDHAKAVIATGYASPDAVFIADKLNLPKIAEKKKK